MLVTRALGQASALAERLRESGAEPVSIPTLEILPPLSCAALDDAILRCFSPGGEEVVDWLIFTSANAVESFARQLGELRQRSPDAALRLDLGHTRQVRTAVIGAATAQALESFGLASLLKEILVPTRAVAESLADALVPHARRADGSPARFVLVRAEEAREIVPDALRAAGAEVILVPAYRTVIPEGSAGAIRTLFAEEQTVDAITFTSSSSVRNLLALCEVAGVNLPVSALRVSIGPVTTQTLRQLGYPPHAEAPEANIGSLVETVMRMVGKAEG